MLVSSANSMKVPKSEELAISFMYRRKSSGPKTEPCGTPYLMIRFSDFSLRTSVYCVLFDK